MSKKRILLVDTLNSMFTLYHRQQPGKLWTFLSDLRGIVEQFKFDRVVLATEGGSSQYRLGLLPSYKSERRKRRDEAPPEEKAALKRFLEEDVKDFLDTAKLLDFLILQVKGAEADDLIGFYANNIDLDKYQLCVLSSDTDLHQLLRPGIVQASYGKDMIMPLQENARIPAKVWLNSATFQEQHGIDPRQYTLVKSLSGDTSDSIPSPEGVGESYALGLIQLFGDLDGVEAQVNKMKLTPTYEAVLKHGSAAAVEEAIKAGDPDLCMCWPKMAHFKKALKADFDHLPVPRMSTTAKLNLANGGMEIVRRNVELVNLNYGPETAEKVLGAQGVAYLHDSLTKLDTQVPDKDAVKELMLECGKVGLAERLDFWLHPFTAAG